MPPIRATARRYGPDASTAAIAHPLGASSRGGASEYTPRWTRCSLPRSRSFPDGPIARGPSARAAPARAPRTDGATITAIHSSGRCLIHFRQLSVTFLNDHVPLKARSRRSSPPCDTPGVDEIRFDEQRPRAVRDAGRGHRRGAHAGLHERGGARAHARDGRDALLEPLARRAVAQGGDLRATRCACGRCGTTATRTRWSRWSIPPGPPATPASAPASTAARWTRSRARRWRRWSARSPSEGAPTRPSSYTATLLTSPESIGEKVREEASEVARGGAERVRRAPGRGGRRRALPPVGADGLARPEPARRLRGAEPARRVIPSLEEVRALAREHTLVPLRHTYVADTETPGLGLPQAARRRPVVPARVRRAGAALRALVVPRLPPAGGDPLEPGRRADDPYELVERELGRYKLAPVDGLPPFAGGAVGMFGYDLVRSAEPTVGEGNPDELGTPDMALMVSDVLVAFDHLRHEITILANVFVEDDVDEAYAKAVAAIDDVRERLAQPVPRAHAERREPPSFTSNIGSEGYAAAVERCKEYIRAGDVYQVVPEPALERRRAGRRVLDLPRPARDQPQPLHVLPGLRGLRDRGRLTRVADQGRGPPRRAAPDRRHPAARRDRRRRPGARRGAAGRREGARRARDAGGPGPQRPRPRVRVRHASRSTS